MHSVFWKIFLSFWAALLLFTLATVFTAGFLIERKLDEQSHLSPREYLHNLIDEARAVARRGGREGLKRWLQRIDRREAIPVLLIDAQGHDLLGRPVPERFVDRLTAPDYPPPEARRHHDRRELPIVRLPDGTIYHLTPDFHSFTLSRILVRPRLIALPVTLGALISGVVCFLLARYLVRPLGQLHRAAEEYARGNLATRVAPSLRHRRDEIADLALAFDHMAEQLELLLHSHKQLLRDVSHELRSPLARMQVALELARTRSGDTQSRELDRIALEADRLNELIGQLLSLARLDSQEQTRIHEPVNVTALLHEIVADARFEGRAKPIELQLPDDADSHVTGDPALLHSALENIVRNAIRHTGTDTPVEIRLRQSDSRPGWLRIEVRDHGPGVPEILLPRLFEPFVRVDEARSREHGGYGLGLAIAKRVIQLHGGDIHAENAADGGLRLVLQLPLENNLNRKGE